MHVTACISEYLLDELLIMQKKELADAVLLLQDQSEVLNAADGQLLFQSQHNVLGEAGIADAMSTDPLHLAPGQWLFYTAEAAGAVRVPLMSPQPPAPPLMRRWCDSCLIPPHIRLDWIHTLRRSTFTVVLASNLKAFVCPFSR